MNPQDPQNPEPEKQQSAEEVFAKNRRDALRLAREVYRTVVDPEFVKIDPQVRMKTVQDKVPEFCKAYPSVVRWMVRDLKYNEQAFNDYLNMLEREHYSDKKPEPGKGYLEYIRKQAEYSRMLYKRSVPHWDPKIANRIFNSEYEAMLKTYNEMKDEETEIKSEFDDEKKVHKSEKIAEIVDFISSMKGSKGGVRGEAPDSQPPAQNTLEKLRSVAQIVDYRMQQADALAKGTEVPTFEKGATDKDSLITQEQPQLSEEEIQKRQARYDAEIKAAEDEQLRQTTEHELKLKTRAQSFAPGPTQKRTTKNTNTTTKNRRKRQ
jgi:hypothetical protein